MRKTNLSSWTPRVLLVVAAVISVVVLLRGLRTNNPASYDAVETRGIELRRSPSADEQLDVEMEDQVSSLDIMPKLALREADPLEPQPPAPPPPPEPRPNPPAPQQQPPAPAPPQKKPFYRPPLQRRGLPKERTSNASTGAFLEAAPKAKPAASAPAPAATGSSSAPDGPRVFRDIEGKATIRN